MGAGEEGGALQSYAAGPPPPGPSVLGLGFKSVSPQIHGAAFDYDEYVPPMEISATHVYKTASGSPCPKTGVQPVTCRCCHRLSGLPAPSHLCHVTEVGALLLLKSDEVSACPIRKGGA